MNKIYTFSKLGTHGALGNQLWEIAGVIGEAYYKYGHARFPDWEYRPYFNIPAEHFGPIPDDAVDFYPSYMQDIGHFRLSTSYIHNIFQPSVKVVDDLDSYALNFRKFNAVHVRRANNLSLPDHHPVCPLEYYEAAIDSLPKRDLWVFSDDIDWCSKQSIFKDAMFGVGPPSGINIYDLTGAQPLTTYEAALDLHAMAQCSAHVISNSSFSWWGAWLGSAHVRYPSRWYGPALEHINTSVMFPRHWQKIEFEESWSTK